MTWARAIASIIAGSSSQYESGGGRPARARGTTGVAPACGRHRGEDAAVILVGGWRWIAGELRRGLGGSIRLSIGDGGDDLEECRKVSPSAPFIGRPVATTLLTIGVALAGFFAFMRLPVAPLPQVDYPTI